MTVTTTTPELAPTRVRARWWVAAVAFVVVAVALGLMIGPVAINPGRVLLVLLDHIPGVHVDTGLSARATDIVWQLRAPRVAMGLLVGAMLAVAGASYQGAFRNPLADPYLLGVAAGAGLGATFAITAGASVSSGIFSPVPLAAFIGALAAVVLTYTIGGAVGLGATARLVLAGVAIASFLTALQTYVQQQNSDAIREVYSWILGRLTTASWRDIAILTPYVLTTAVVIVMNRRTLDVLGVGDEEASSLGLRVDRSRLWIVAAASLGTAAAVSVSGLIGFVGIIVPHTIRLVVGQSYRVILPLSLLCGAGFLVLADLLARTVVQPAELPIGVITALFGAPFFLLVLRKSRAGSV
ncbi:MAG: FecCD family ABC transporter permease [Acidimicrobiia bacterium]